MAQIYDDHIIFQCDESLHSIHTQTFYLIGLHLFSFKIWCHPSYAIHSITKIIRTYVEIRLPLSITIVHEMQSWKIFWHHFFFHESSLDSQWSRYFHLIRKLPQNVLSNMDFNQNVLWWIFKIYIPYPQFIKPNKMESNVAKYQACLHT